MPPIKQKKNIERLELITVLVIIGLLSVITIPLYFKIKKLAYYAEAQYVLNDIYDLQQSYYSFNNIYSTLDKIGFIKKDRLKYTYKLLLADKKNFLAQAIANLDNDETDFDIWQIDQDNNLKHISID